MAFNVQPRATGQLLVGSSRQFDVDDPGVDAALLARMIRRAGEFLPGLDQLVAIRAWTGVRAATPDKLPLIGPFEPCPGVILATGHDGLGITTSLATARLVAHHVAGASAPLDPAPYLPSRFQGLGASASSGAETGASRV